jgi:glucose-1-phosphate adenylyltransferase
MRAIGIILAGGPNDRLGLLAQKRAPSAMPIGGCYRAIDFSLSNMSNSGISKVAVITQYNSRSLHDHLSSSKWWNLGRKQGGLFVFSPYLTSNNSYWFKGTADSIFQNMTYLMKSNEPYVVIAHGDGIYKMDFSEIIKQHINTGADITIGYKRINDTELQKYGILEVDGEGNIMEFEEKPIDPSSNTASMGIYVIQRTLLIKLLETISSEGRSDFVRDVIMRYRKKLKMMGYEYFGYWKAVNSIRNYFDTNMDFLDRNLQSLFTKEYPYINTKPKDEPPAKYNYSATAKNVIAGSGSIINGEVMDSVLFRRVFLSENSSVQNSIIMEGSYIGSNCTVKYAIIDKEVTISNNSEIIGTYDEPKLVTKGAVMY